MHRVALHPGATTITPAFGGLKFNRKCSLIRAVAGNGPSRGFSSATKKQREDTRYGEEEYWNKRYAEEAFMTFDWYQRYADLQPILKKHIPKSARVLMAGCGNAVMSEDMVRDGYQNIVNVDYSSVLINALQYKYKHMPQLSYKTMDVRNMGEFKDNTFDAAIDKGLVDAMVCATNGAGDVTQMLREMYRVIKPGGNFVMVTYGFPLIRVPALMDRGMSWITNCWILPKPYSGSELSEYPNPIPMEVQNFINTKQEHYATGTNFVYVATKRS
ncbi:EEF1A lysine methyltransferase 4 [Selaginella moellendorffii]|nr:EEF1A lysine methyltransferase 4 [Selaginella moellendorffii]|eukprot:XP_024533842.1 EEF1A lysine methyltransferase 4 [Selaginella moellendorffii]